MPNEVLKFIIDAENRSQAVLAQVKSQLEGVQGKMEDMSPAFKKMAAIGTASFAAITGAVALSVKSYIDAGDEVQKMAIRTGFGTKALSELRYAAQLSGASLESLELATKTMSKFIDNANDEIKKAGKTMSDQFTVKAQGAAEKVSKLSETLDDARIKLAELTGAQDVNEKAVSKQIDKITKLEEELSKAKNAIISIEEPTLKSATSLAKLGLTMEDLKGLSPEETFWKLAEGIAGIDEPMTRSAMALEIFGRQGTNLLPLFEAGSEGIAKMRAEAEELGITFDEAGAQKAAAFHDQLTKLKGSFTGVQMTIAEVFLPILKEVLDKITPVISQVKDWIDKNPELTLKITGVALAISGLLIVLGTLGLILPNIIAGITLLGTAFSFLLANPIVLAIAAIIAVITLWIVKWKEFKDTILWTWGIIKEETFKVWNSIKDFFQGIWDDITKIFTTAYDRIMGIVNSVKSAISSVSEKVSNIGSKIGAGISKILPFQEGGIVTRPTLGLLGESGAEAVIPLRKGGFGGITVIINGGYFLSETVAEEIGDVIVEKIKRNNKLW
jgi:TP901 family phage tail tape measure protein